MQNFVRAATRSKICCSSGKNRRRRDFALRQSEHACRSRCAVKANRETARAAKVVRYRSGESLPDQPDEVAVEEPLEIRIEGRSIAVVMRTPGHDRELAAGFALTEGIVRDGAEIFEITSCLTTDQPAGNIVEITLADPAKFDAAKLSRHVFSSSSCGICGKATIEAAMQQFPPIRRVAEARSPNTVRTPSKTGGAQETFQRTGGLHACALFDSSGDLPALARGCRAAQRTRQVDRSSAARESASVRRLHPPVERTRLVRDDAKSARRRDCDHRRHLRADQPRGRICART